MKKTGINRFKKIFITVLLIAIQLFCCGCLKAKPKVNTDINKYQNYIGDNADKEYKDKWGIDESIFPKTITDNMKVQDYKMVYYNPWDAQFLSYIFVKYDKEAYKNEVNRLEKYNSNDYIGYYGAKGFNSKYELLAMNADTESSQGFVYALSNKKDTIVYVEIIFCNYFMDLEYYKYINEEFLPIGFDAKSGNPYGENIRSKMGID